jgi:hypothetical protein
MKGSEISHPLPGVTLACISQEANDLLERVMAAWEIHLANLKAVHGESYEPSHYRFAYWLIRYSGLVEPSHLAE